MKEKDTKKIYENIREKIKNFENLFFKNLNVKIKFSLNNLVFLKTDEGNIFIDYDGCGLLRNILIKKENKGIEEKIKNCLKKIGVKDLYKIKIECSEKTKEDFDCDYYFTIIDAIRRIYY